jgi:hypothetical protein
VLAKHESRASQPQQRLTSLSRRLWWLGVLVVAVALGAWWGWPEGVPRAAPSNSALPEVSAVEPRVRREPRPTLDPSRFVGRAAVAHQVAREIPDVLDQLYCYCGCDKLAGHKSLLSCYTDGHAAT